MFLFSFSKGALIPILGTYKACSRFDISLPESLKNNTATSSTKLGLASSCKSSTWRNCSSRWPCHKNVISKSACDLFKRTMKNVEWWGWDKKWEASCINIHQKWLKAPWAKVRYIIEGELATCLIKEALFHRCSLSSQIRIIHLYGWTDE
jgi:hypothetical protein